MTLTVSAWIAPQFARRRRAISDGEISTIDGGEERRPEDCCRCQSFALLMRWPAAACDEPILHLAISGACAWPDLSRLTISCSDFCRDRDPARCSRRRPLRARQLLLSPRMKSTSISELKFSGPKAPCA